MSLLSFYEGKGLPKAIERDIDALLSEEAEERGIFNPLSLPLSSLAKTAYWKGDIRRMATDGIVFSINPNLDGSLAVEVDILSVNARPIHWKSPP